MKMKPISSIKADLGINADGRIQRYFTEQCAKHMDKYVPFDSGNLALYRLEPRYIHYEQLYARYQYRGMREDGTHIINEANRNRSKHPLATSYWDKKMVTAEMPEVIRKVQEKLNGR
jgi:uncharacterized protein YpiB (UPF0302 family)